MVEKCPQYSALPSPSMPYGACYKHVQSVPLSMSTTPPAQLSTALPSSPGIGIMTPTASKFGTVIRDRIFVGGIDFKTTEEDLQKFFSAFGAVRETKVIRDRADVSKGYGFVTFSSHEEVNKLLREQEDCLYLNGKKLNIGPAIRKQPVYYPKDFHVPGPVCSWVLHPGGYASYTNANGITYFQAATQLLSPQVALQNQQPYMMACNGSAQALSSLAQPMAQYTGFNQGAGVMQPIHGGMSIPWSPTQAGSCGQILTSVPTLEHNQAMNLSMIPVAPANSTNAPSPTDRSGNGANQCNKGGPVVAAAVPQTHIQIPTSYVCSPIPAQQSVPMRFAPHSGPQMIHTVTDSPQQVMHSVNFNQQICTTPTLGSKGHTHVAMPVGANGEMAIALTDSNLLPAYGMQPAIYPNGSLVGVPDIGVTAQYTSMPGHQASEVLTPPPTPEIQSQAN